MTILGLGTDIVEINRIEKAITKNDKFLSKVFTEKEISYCEKKGVTKFQSYAGRFCAKEAIAKAMGTGVREFELVDIEIQNDDLGKPFALFKGSLVDYFSSKELVITISHCKEYATATAIITKK